MKPRSNGSYATPANPASDSHPRRPSSHLARRASARTYPIADEWDQANCDEDEAYAADEYQSTWEQRSQLIDSGWDDDSDEDAYGYAYDEAAYAGQEHADSGDYAYTGQYQSGYADEIPQPVYSSLANGPTPSLIALATLGVCMLLAAGLLNVTSRATLALNLAGAAAAAQPALDQSAALVDDAPAEAIPAAEPVVEAAPPPAGECAVSDLFPQKVRRWCDLITAHANQHGLAPDLVAALIWLESGGDDLAYSRSGAVGLMQVMPSDGPAANFMCINGPCFSDRPTIVQLQDPAFNVKYGTRMLAGLLNRKGDLREALKSYGPMDVGYSYADQVLSIFQRNTK